MKILLSHRYFWPDAAPYGAMLRTIGAALAEAGHDVEVFSTLPGYRGCLAAPRRERLDRVAVARIGMLAESGPLRNLSRALNAVAYCLRLGLHILRARPDLVTASSSPPVLAAVCASLAARAVGAKFIYHVQDIHPEVSELSGGCLGGGWPGGWARRILRDLDNRTILRAAVVIVPGADMALTLRARAGLRNLDPQVIENFALEDFSPIAMAATAQRRDGRFQVIFAGNLGRFQGLVELTGGLATCFPAHPELEIVFLGSGAAEASLKSAWADHPQVRFLPLLPFASARPIIAGADIGLVALNEGLHRVAYPSKIATYLGLGLPVLALIDPECAAARMIRDEGLGAVPASRRPEDIGAALVALMDPGILTATRTRVRALAAGRLSRAALVARFAEALTDVVRRSGEVAPAPNRQLTAKRQGARVGEKVGRRILLLSNGDPRGISSTIFAELAGFLGTRHEVRHHRNPIARRDWPRVLAAILPISPARLRDVIWCDTVMVHPYAFFSLGTLLMACLLGRRTICFAWDVYPTSFAGQPSRRGLRARSIARLERLAQALVGRHVIPSADFRGSVRGRDLVEMPLWPLQNQRAENGAAIAPAMPDNGVIRVAFAGQLNPLRGLEEAAQRLAALAEVAADGGMRPLQIELHVFTRDPMPDTLLRLDSAAFRIVQRGYLGAEDFSAALAQMQFGLVSLHPMLDQPGFPSKTYSYVASGLPILYFGRALPAYCALLAELGLGVDITPPDTPPLSQLHTRIAKDFGAARQELWNRTALDWGRIEQVL